MRALRLCAVALTIVSVAAIAAPAQARVPAGDVAPTAAAQKTAKPTGPALIRIDVASATVTPAAGNSSVLTLTAAPAVTWMGETTTAGGKKRLVVGHLKAKDLRGRWATLKLARQDSARATLTWNPSSDAPGFALVALQRPTIDAAGRIAIPIVSTVPLPADLIDVTVNIDRAGSTAKKFRATSKFPEYFSYWLTENGYVNTTATTGYDAVFNLNANGRTCFTSQIAPNKPVLTLPPLIRNCGGVDFSNGVVTLTVATTSTDASLLYTSGYTPAGSPMTLNFSTVVSSWLLYG